MTPHIRVYPRAIATELPQDDTTVLLFHPEWPQSCELGWYDKGHWFTAEGATLEPHEAPTHWALLPDIDELEGQVPFDHEIPA